MEEQVKTFSQNTGMDDEQTEDGRHPGKLETHGQGEG